jgi:hypothetical protein
MDLTRCHLKADVFDGLDLLSEKPDAKGLLEVVGVDENCLGQGATSH